MLVNKTEGSNGIYKPEGSTRAPAFINAADPISRCLSNNNIYYSMRPRVLMSFINLKALLEHLPL